MQLSAKALQVKASSTLSIGARVKEMKASGMDVMGFDAGEPDFATPEHIKQAAIQAIEDGFTKYTPSAGILELRKAICEKLRNENGLIYEPNQIVVNNGAKHSLTNICAAILNDGEEVLIPAPFWLSYPQMVFMAGGKPVIISTKESNGFKVTRGELDAALTEKTKAIIVNNPCNPTGEVYTKDELQVIADFAVEHDLFVISDEVYEKLIYTDDHQIVSIGTLNEEIFARTIVVNSFSKTYSMTGWRIGYSASSKEIAKVIDNIQSHGTSNPNSIAQKAAVAACLGDQNCVEDMRKEYHARRDYIYSRICEIPMISAIKPKGAFYIFVNVGEFAGKIVDGRLIKDSFDVAELLLERHKVSVVPGNDFGFDQYIRLSFAVSMESIQKGMDRIQEFAESFSV